MDSMKQQHVVQLSKDAGRSLNADKLRVQLETIVSGVQTAQRTARGWSISLANANGQFYTEEYIAESAYSGKKVYHANINIDLDTDKPRTTIPSELDTIITSIAAKCAYPKWYVTAKDGEEYTVKSPEDMVLSQDPSKVDAAEAVGYAPIAIPENWEDYFNHLYGLDDHISRIKKALDAAILSNWRHRFNCVLVGPPGCGKSDICQSIKRALGEEAVLEFDGTSTTMAGAQKELSDREELPRVLLVEEIEKAPESSMSWLLSLMDLRGEVRKTTARSQILRDTKMICIATVNNYETFKRFNFGALESRYSNKIFFQRPTRELLGKILEREIASVNGDMRWINPTLDYAEAINTTDPREIIAVALCGRDTLLTGEYQHQLLTTGMPQAEDSANSGLESRLTVGKLLAKIENDELDYEREAA